jgi:hypothetical protein
VSLPNLWPAERPDVEPADFGWFEPCAEELLSKYVGEETKVIVELGSWLGKSTRWFLEAAPQATVIAIDHWKGSPEHKRFGEDFRRLLWSRFLQNCWDYRERLVPIKMRTVAGMKAVAEAGHSPDLVYVDAAHDMKSAQLDIEAALTLWPRAQITGDDWIWGAGSHYPVRRAVQAVGRERNMGIEVNGNTWALHL